MIALGGGHYLDPILAAWDVVVLTVLLVPPALFYKRVTR